MPGKSYTIHNVIKREESLLNACNLTNFIPNPFRIIVARRLIDNSGRKRWHHELHKRIQLSQNGTDQQSSGNEEDVKRKRAPYLEDTRHRIEIAIFMDVYSYFNSHTQGNARQATQYILATMNMVNMIFHHSSLGTPIGLYITKIYFMTDQPSLMKTNGLWKEYLRQFCNYVQSKYTNSEGTLKWDNALLYTGIDLHDGKSSSVVGGAYTGEMCRPKSCAIAEGGLHKGYNIYIEIAHELGHNLGFGHDDGTQNPQCIERGYIMRAFAGDRVEFWSQCSREHLATVLHKYLCLLDRGGPNPKELDISNQPGWGIKVTATEQCEQMRGVGSYQYSSKTEKYPICDMMACAKTSPYSNLITFSTMGAALEMTHCGPRKWCRNTRCVPIPASMLRGGASAVATPIDGKWGPWKPFEKCSNGPCVTGAQPFEYWVRTCSGPYPNFGGRPCEGGETTPIKYTPVQCQKLAKKCPKLISVKSYDSEYCSKRKSSYPHITGAVNINYADCQYECVSADPTLSFPVYNMPNGIACSDNKTMFCFMGKCTRVPKSINELSPRVGKMDDLIKTGLLAPNKNKMGGITAPPLLFAGTVSKDGGNEKSTRKGKISSNDQFVYYDETDIEVNLDLPKEFNVDEFEDYILVEETGPPDTNASKTNSQKSKSKSDKKSHKGNKTEPKGISVFGKTGGVDYQTLPLSRLYILGTTLIVSALLAGILGHYLYKRRQLDYAAHYYGQMEEEPETGETAYGAEENYYVS